MSSTVLDSQKNDPSFDNIWDELKWRGLIQVSTDETELRDALAVPGVKYYCGFDPTAPSLHLGNLVQLLVLRRLQLAGHHPFGLVGGSTGLVGDPGGRNSERVLNPREVVAEWVGYLQAQVSKFLSFEGDNAAKLVNNLDWTQPLSAIDFLRDVGKHFRVNQMIKKEMVANRLESEDGISYTEFSYQILQGLDYLELHRQYGVTLQTGGSDQWGNLTSGVDLIRRVEGASVHAFGTPLITNSDGTKFGKSMGNAVWLDENLTSPYAFYQFWLNSADADVIKLLRVFTFLTRAEIAEFERSVADEPHLRKAQKELAWQVTSLVHGAKATQAAIDASQALFGQGDLSGLDAGTLSAAIAELPSASAATGTLVIELLQASGLTASLGEGRRAIAQGGVYLNNAKVLDADQAVSEANWLAGDLLVLRRGKKTLAGISKA